MKTRLTFLGTGTSQGIPIIGCRCPVCSSEDPRDKRLRASVFVEYGPISMLVDCGPDFRAQMLRARICHIDGVLLTHNHKDHTGGLDDLRSFNLLEHKPVNIYCEEYVKESLRREYSYAFTRPLYPGAPEWNVICINGRDSFEVSPNDLLEDLVWEKGKGYYKKPPVLKAPPRESVQVIPIQGWHNRQRDLSVLGFRFGDIAYITDFCSIDDSEIENKLQGLRAVTVNCVQRGQHHSHFSLDEALMFLEKVGAEQSYITHLSHLLPKHADFENELPENIHPAYDGLTIE